MPAETLAQGAGCFFSMELLFCLIAAIGTIAEKIINRSTNPKSYPQAHA